MEMDEVKKVLNKIGVDEVDDYLLELSFNFKKRELLNFLNTDKVPERLEYLLLKMAVCDYLSFSYSNKLLPEKFNFSKAVKSIKEGDTQVDFSTKALSDEEKFAGYINDLKTSWMVEAVGERKIRW